MAEPALSPSRAKDFSQCPLLFRLRTIDRIPEAPSLVAIRGTCIHSALEDLFLVPPAERTPTYAQQRYRQAWQKWRTENPDDYASLQLDEAGEAENTATADQLIENYFQLEDPTFLQPRGREQFMEAITADGIRLRGIIDRIDIAPAGVRIVDYKSGKSPHPNYVAGALFQMRFYALLYKLNQDVVVRRLQLLYLRDIKSLTLDPTPSDLQAIAAEISGIWAQIEAAIKRRDFPPRRTKLCDWCHFQQFCPAFGGQPPQLADSDLERISRIRVRAQH